MRQPRAHRLAVPLLAVRRLAAPLLAALFLTVLVSGCGGARPAASAAQPPVVPGETTQGPDLSGVQLPDFVMPLIHGGLSQPNPKLTPGAVTAMDPNDVCTSDVHALALSTAVQTAVWTEYGETSASAMHKHILDLLVPYDLGGAAVKSNLWPAAISGTGFYQKVETDKVLRQMVCRGEVTLSQAQQALETNWYSAWLRYVVATGHV